MAELSSARGFAATFEQNSAIVYGKQAWIRVLHNADRDSRSLVLLLLIFIIIINIIINIIIILFNHHYHRVLTSQCTAIEETIPGPS